jgi:hypothetical protein
LEDDEKDEQQSDVLLMAVDQEVLAEKLDKKGQIQPTA